MILLPHVSSLQDNRIPRASGGDPVDAARFIDFYTVFPAQAGVIPRSALLRYRNGSIPRASGGDPGYSHYTRLPNLYSPRKRG